MFEINTSSSKNIYQQIVDNIKDLIAQGILKENDKLPSVREMASLLKVNISTIQKSYQILEQEKIIKTMVGKGTFITDNLDTVAPNYELIEKLLQELIREAKFAGLSKKDLLSKVEQCFNKEWYYGK